MKSVSKQLDDERAMVEFGRALGAAWRRQRGGVVWLQGDLGMGKTTLCRGILQAFGHSGAVKSPTYTLVEPYEFDHRCVYHFDLYRLGDPEELEYMGIRDYFSDYNLCLVEWPERGGQILPAADIVVRIEAAAPGRLLTLTAGTVGGESVLGALQ